MLYVQEQLKATEWLASLGNWIYEEDIGKMCSFLISNDGARISGQIIGIDGNTIRMH